MPLNTYTHLGLEDAVDALKKIEEERARQEIERGRGTMGRMDGITRITRSSTTTSRITWQSAFPPIWRTANDGKYVYVGGKKCATVYV